MESLPAEILAHVFEQFSKCEICQKDCLRATKKWKSLFKCSDTCARWSKILAGKPIYKFGWLSHSQYVIGKCFPDHQDIISVTIDIKNAKSLGLKVLNLMQTFTIDFLNQRGLIIHSIDQAGPVALDGKIKDLDENWIGNSILQVNGIDLKFPMTFADALQIIKDVVENPKFQTVQLIINQNVSISGYIRFGCHGNYNQYPI